MLSLNNYKYSWNLDNSENEHGAVVQSSQVVVYAD